MGRVILIVVPLVIATTSTALAQDAGRVYVGGLFGVSTLSADGRSVVMPPVASVSLYKPENGPATDVFIGARLGRFVSVQANYIWNRNDLTLISSLSTPDGGSFLEQGHTSGQHAVIADVLVYFRAPQSRVRPYLSTGAGLIRLESQPGESEQSAAASHGPFTAARPALRLAVGIDVMLNGVWSFRYTYSDTISSNPVSMQLMPAGERDLANFQSLFGLVLRL